MENCESLNMTEFESICVGNRASEFRIEFIPFVLDIA